MLSKKSKIERFAKSRENRFLAASAPASPGRKFTKLCGRFLMTRYGPSAWRARRLVRARHDRDRTGSGGKRPPNPESEAGVPVGGGDRAAEGRAEVPRTVAPRTAAQDTATAIAACPGRA